TLNITGTRIDKILGGIPGQYYFALIITYSAPVPVFPSSNEGVTFAGLTTRTSLNGQILYPPARPIFVPGLLPTQMAFIPYGTATSPQTPDTGTASFTHQPKVTMGTSGATQPVWNTTGTTIDGTITWTNAGPSASKWGLTTPTTAPIVSATNGDDAYCQPYSGVPQYYSTLASERTHDA